MWIRTSRCSSHMRKKHYSSRRSDKELTYSALAPIVRIQQGATRRTTMLGLCIMRFLISSFLRNWYCFPETAVPLAKTGLTFGSCRAKLGELTETASPV